MVDRIPITNGIFRTLAIVSFLILPEFNKPISFIFPHS